MLNLFEIALNSDKYPYNSASPERGHQTPKLSKTIKNYPGTDWDFTIVPKTIGGAIWVQTCFRKLSKNYQKLSNNYLKTIPDQAAHPSAANSDY